MGTACMRELTRPRTFDLKAHGMGGGKGDRANGGEHGHEHMNGGDHGHEHMDGGDHGHEHMDGGAPNGNGKDENMGNDNEHNGMGDDANP
ncbi:hypothetical protein LBRM_23_1110 [Leishmania braziliensis MHOM/BR/75/M2904]|uniref:Uncharacterized protein n=1 Tax=Leishmania braziliensis TaxID=5660 RepID=A4HCX2_LEIBR|nr:hypothetical protein LBRM_23_1110 [Leishmania braziliensis MHOM/BR/75/M2904]CAJ2473254.1 unnamed protein product [Leishmania braziliensis]CAM36618.1 hypothetical protein LBRM_23_1110 [Leishmania braziliensis MHOM/BR/75/M2904]